MVKRAVIVKISRYYQYFRNVIEVLAEYFKSGLVLAASFFFFSCSLNQQTSYSAPPEENLKLLRNQIVSAVKVFEVITASKADRVPVRYVKRARCLAIFPGVIKAAFIAGANHGYGLGVCRVKDRWSRIAFFGLTGGSFGFQFGAEVSDLLLLFMDQEAAQSLMENQLTLGVDVGIVAGPSGESMKEKTNANLEGILAYSIAEGAFAGLSVEGAVLTPDEASNIIYHKDYTEVSQLLTEAHNFDLNTEEELLLGSLNHFSAISGTSTQTKK